MASRKRVGLVGLAVTLVGLSGLVGAGQQPERESSVKPDFDVRSERTPARASARALAELMGRERRRGGDRGDVTRLHPHTGAIRVLDAPGWSIAQSASTSDLRALLQRSADSLGLDDEDLESLTAVRDYVSRSTGLRHVTYAQTLGGLPVFGASIAMHIAPDGAVVRVTSSAARGAGRALANRISAEEAAAAAAGDILPGLRFVPLRTGSGPRADVARFARGEFKRDLTASLEWFAIDGTVRLAWHVEIEPEGVPQFYDVMIDAATGELLLRHNRVLDAEGSGRVIQSDQTQAADPRRPDQMPSGSGACPPVLNHQLRDLTQPFRDPATVLFNTGRLSGNNAHVFRGNSSTEGVLGTFDGTRWTFDSPFNSAASAETSLFFALNFAHDFFYDLGFDEASGNFQVNNFGRGGTGGDPITGLARAAGRNNATFQPAPEGQSPIMSMFLFDGSGCWAQDVDGDGSLDLDGDYDADIVLHEFHHGVSHRLNTSFTGSEANAMGEGGSDYFAYTVNGDTTLAEYAFPGGLRQINAKTYADWTCLLVIFCEEHANGEIWANVMWDVRERFRTDLVRGTEAAAINEASQLYVDALKLSPPSPTMLDMRDAMLLADSIRNPGTPNSQNYCRLWESFAARGMGVNATDTSDNGFNQVGAGFGGPAGCNAPPAPLTVSVSASDSTAHEAGPGTGAFTVSRSEASSTALTVNVTIAGSATPGSDYAPLSTTVTIPPDALTVVVPVGPIDDAIVEGNETVALAVAAGAGYLPGTPSSATVTIVSDDAAPDLTVTTLTVPAASGPGLTISVSDTTRNQGVGAAAASTTSFYLSLNTVLDTTDPQIGSRQVPGLSPSTNDVATTTLTIPVDTEPGTYRLFAKADGPSQLVESSEGNNARSATIRIGPDLTITALSTPANIAASVPFAASYTLANSGGIASGDSTTRFYLSPDPTLSTGDRALQSHSVGAIGVGASVPFNVMLSVPSDTEGGTYYVIAVADGNQQVPESSETNNARSDLTRVGSDLRVSALTVPVRASAGVSFTVSDTTKNFGVGNAGESHTAFYLSANVLLDASDKPLNVSRLVGPLLPNEQSVATSTITLPADTAPGAWYIIANADDSNEVAESNENNNSKFAAVNVGPDLSVSASTAPTTITAGTSITVSDTVKNSGIDPAGASTTRFYLSLNNALDGNDTPLNAERLVPSLVMNATSIGSTSVPIPSGFSGRYYLLIVADGYGVVAESSEVNNIRSIVVTINP
jgi:subtilase family serine protease